MKVSRRPKWAVYRGTATPRRIFSLRSNIDLSHRERLEENASSLAQSKPARDDAAQHLRGAALNGELGRGLDREGQLIFQRFVVRRVGIDEGCEIANPVRQLLLPDPADGLDAPGFDHRFPSGLPPA